MSSRPLDTPLCFIDTLYLDLGRHYRDKDKLHQKFIVERTSPQEIAEEFQCSVSTVYKQLKKFGFIKPRQKLKRAREAKPEERIVRLIYQLRELELSLREIADALSFAGFPTRAQKRKWHAEMVNRVLEK